jgi:hypothetical protein
MNEPATDPASMPRDGQRARVTVGPFAPERLVAVGARAETWLAAAPRGLGISQRVAVKIARGPRDRDVVMREARLLAAVNHPHVAQLVLAAPDGAWLATEWVQGQAIHRWAADRSLDEVLRVFAELLSGVLGLAQRQVVHADLKPQNVLVDAYGHPKIVDLGAGLRPGTIAETFRGTPGFVAPELLAGEPVSAATDLYGAAAVLYATLTGHAPFESSDPASLFHLPLTTLPLPPSAWRPDVPHGVDQLILAMLARRPERRPTIEAVVERLISVDLPSQPAPVRQLLLGMRDARRRLRTAIARVVAGQPSVVVVHGPPGCGRRTLLAETLDAAAREGVEVVAGADLGRQLLSPEGGPRAAALDGAAPVVQDLARQVLAKKLPRLILLRTDSPVGDLGDAGAVHVSPEPLTIDEVAALALHEGAIVDAREVWGRTGGLPAAVWAAVAARTGRRRPLGPAADRILGALNVRKSVVIVDLARSLGWPAHRLLDHAAPLLAAGHVRVSRDGRSLVKLEQG